LAAPLESIATGGWHEVIARYDGAKTVKSLEAWKLRPVN
jgi:hypothetical protein